MDWTTYPNDAAFSGRQSELSVLARNLLIPEPKVVTIEGGPGTGKTSLAMAFAYRNAEAFPAGIYHIHATPLEPLPDTIAARVSNPTKPYLLILDNLESRQPTRWHTEIATILRLRPSARLLCITRSIGLPEEVTPTIKLGNLNRPDFEELLGKLAFPSHTSNEFDALFEAIEGNPLASRLLIDQLKSKSYTQNELLNYLHSFSHAGLVGVDGKPLASRSREEHQIITDIKIVSDDLLKQVYFQPKLIYEVTPRRFEEFVAELLDRLGYEVNLTPASNDGGKDIYAAKKDDLGSFLYVVECKKYAPDNHVGVGLIRQLNGVVQAEHATAGILATTSFFTRGAKEFQARLSNQISLKDYLGIQEWLHKIFRRDA